MSPVSMRPTATSLADLQRQMAAAVMMPLTPDEHMRAYRPRRTRDGRCGRIVHRAQQPAHRRSSALRSTTGNIGFACWARWRRIFPALRAVVGAKRFEALSVAYLTAHPSRSFSLRNLGSKLVEWLTANPHWTGRRHALAVDLARIEWAFVEAFDNAERTPLTLDQIATLDAGSRLALQPHVRLLALIIPPTTLPRHCTSREKRQTSEAGVTHEEESEAPAGCPGCAGGRHGWRPIAWTSMSTIDAWSARSFSRSRPFATAIRWARRWRRDLLRRTSGGATAQSVCEWFAAWAELGWICAPDLEAI